MTEKWLLVEHFLSFIYYDYFPTSSVLVFYWHCYQEKEFTQTFVVSNTAELRIHKTTQQFNGYLKGGLSELFIKRCVKSLKQVISRKIPRTRTPIR